MSNDYNAIFATDECAILTNLKLKTRLNYKKNYI